MLIPIGIFSLAKGSLTYMHMLELVPSHLRGNLHTISQVVTSSICIISILFFYFVPNAKLFLPLMGTLCFLHLIPVIRVPESPRFLYIQERWEELHEAFDTIAYSNGVATPKLKFRKELYEDETEPLKVISMMEALKDYTYFKNLFIMTLNWSVCSLSFYVISYYANDFPGSMFINVLFMMIADLISGALSYLVFVKWFSLNHGFSIAYIFVVVITIIYSCFPHLQWVEYFCVFSMRFGINLNFCLCYFGSSEIFDVKVRSRSFAVNNYFARF